MWRGIRNNAYYLLNNWLIEPLRKRRARILNSDVVPPRPKIFYGHTTITTISKVVEYDNSDHTFKVDLRAFDDLGVRQLLVTAGNDSGRYQSFFRLIKVGSNAHAIQYRFESVQSSDYIYKISIKNSAKRNEINEGCRIYRQKVVKPFSACIENYSRIFDLLCRGENILPSAAHMGKLVDNLPGITWRIPQKLFCSMKKEIEPYVISAGDPYYLVFHPLACRYMGDNICEYIFANQQIECSSAGLFLSVNTYGAPCVEGTILVCQKHPEKGAGKNETNGGISEHWSYIHAEPISLLGMEGTWAFASCWKTSQSAIFRNPSFHSLWSLYGVEYETLGLRSHPLLVGLFDLLMEILIETQNKNGWWNSDDITLSWRKAIGETPGRLDDRRSTNAAWALYRWSREKGRDDAHIASLKYLLVFKELFDKGYVFRESDNGFLFPDYYHPNFNAKPHASLNHNLNLANYFAHISLVEENLELRNVARALCKGIYLGVRETIDKWVQPDGDLTYGLYHPPGLSPGKDYPTLTYQDLVLTKCLLRYLDLHDTQWIDTLLNSKRKFLQKHGYKFVGPHCLPVEPNKKIESQKLCVFRAGVLDDVKYNSYEKGVIKK